MLKLNQNWLELFLFMKDLCQTKCISNVKSALFLKQISFGYQQVTDIRI